MSNESANAPRVFYFCTHIGSTGHRLHGRYGEVRNNPTPWSQNDLHPNVFAYARAGELSPIERAWKGDKAGTEGAAVLSHKSGWTRVGWPDRRHENSPYAHFDFLVEGTHDFDEALRIAREAFPDVYKRRAAYPIVLSRTVK